MIESISGKIVERSSSSLVIQVSGFGFLVSVPATVNASVGGTITLFIHMHWSQESGPSLYGFETEADRSVFLLVIGCSGIGPKIGIAALSQLGASGIVQAVQKGDSAALSSVSGIGKKKAEQMIVQLKHSVAKLVASGAVVQNGSASHMHEVGQVLHSLNYSKNEVDAALHWLNQQDTAPDVSFDTLMRQALSFLAKRS